MEPRFLKLLKAQAERADHREQEAAKLLRAQEKRQQEEAEQQANLRAEEADRWEAEELLRREEARCREISRMNPMSQQTDVDEYLEAFELHAGSIRWR